MLALQDVEELQAVETGALHPDVEKDELRPPPLEGREGFVGILRGAGSMPFVFENAGDEVPDIGLVVDDQDVGRHSPPLCYRRAVHAASLFVSLSVGNHRRIFATSSSCRDRWSVQ